MGMLAAGVIVVGSVAGVVIGLVIELLRYGHQPGNRPRDARGGAFCGDGSGVGEGR